MSVFRTGRGQCGCFGEHDALRFVAVTGGPGAGKTAVLEMASRSLCRHVGVLPESAGILFGGGFPRTAAPFVLGAAQRAIFRVQRELEWIATEERELAIALCDRGTLDGVAYWPGSPESYYEELETTREAEIARYYAVIHLEPPTEEDGYSNAHHLRIETAKQAREVDGRIKAAWQGHPRRFLVASGPDFMAKASQALAHIAEQLPPCCRGHHA